MNPRKAVTMNAESKPPSRKAQTFQELEVYQEACALDLAIFNLTKAWPKEEMYSLTDQIRRSSRSVGANIAEAWAKRRYPAHFTSKLTDADGELQETEHWLMRAKAYGYLNQEAFDSLWSRSKQVGRRLGAMLNSRVQWSVDCQQ
jgi:four helix bundle protein